MRRRISLHARLGPGDVTRDQYQEERDHGGGGDRAPYVGDGCQRPVLRTMDGGIHVGEQEVQRPDGGRHDQCPQGRLQRSEEHTSELQSLMRISYAVFCLKKKNKKTRQIYLYKNKKK